MSDSSGDTAPIPARLQPLVACIAAALLLAAFTWLATADRLVDHDAPPAVQAAFTASINTASAVELAQLPGLGPATAARIVAYRDTHGPFATLEALLDVPGIGPATLDQMRPYLRPIRPPRREMP
ncbi:MAG: helix-hairpin-helix domain-containing protein [Planctomycetia bacterium]